MCWSHERGRLARPVETQNVAHQLTVAVVSRCEPFCERETDVRDARVGGVALPDRNQRLDRAVGNGSCRRGQGKAIRRAIVERRTRRNGERPPLRTGPDKATGIRRQRRPSTTSPLGRREQSRHSRACTGRWRARACSPPAQSSQARSVADPDRSPGRATCSQAEPREPSRTPAGLASERRPPIAADVAVPAIRSPAPRSNRTAHSLRFEEHQAVQPQRASPSRTRLPVPVVDATSQAPNAG